MRPKTTRVFPGLISDRDPAVDDVSGWRERRLLEAGFEPEQAVTLASECAVDLHALIGLVERGCPPHLAARILAPFDHEVHPC